MCGFLSCMFDEKFKNIPYVCDGERHYFRCKLFVEIELTQGDTSKLMNILNMRMAQFEEFSPFYLKKQIEFENENKETNYLYILESIQKKFLNPLLIVSKI